MEKAPKRRGSLIVPSENGRRKPAGTTDQSLNEESKRDNEPNTESPKEPENLASNQGDAKSALK